MKELIPKNHMPFSVYYSRWQICQKFDWFYGTHSIKNQCKYYLWQSLEWKIPFKKFIISSKCNCFHHVFLGFRMKIVGTSWRTFLFGCLSVGHNCMLMRTIYKLKKKHGSYFSFDPIGAEIQGSEKINIFPTCILKTQIFDKDFLVLIG